MKAIKISESYWNKLSEKEKRFIQENVYSFNLQYCKRVISIAKMFNYTEIVNLSKYQKDDLAKSLSGSVWLIFRDGQMIGKITKSYGFGITERIFLNLGNSMIEVWNNFTETNPKKEVVLKISKA